MRRGILWMVSPLILAVTIMAVASYVGTASPAATASTPAPAPSKALAFSDIAKLPLGPQRQKLLEEGARKEGVVNWYGSMRGMEELANAFKQKYPWLKVEVFSPGSAALVEKTLAEARAGKLGGDIVAGSPSDLAPFFALLQEFRNPNAEFGVNPLAAVVTGNLLVFVYHTQRVNPADVPQQLEDLLKPRWKGKLGLYTPPNTFPAQWTGTLIKFWREERTNTFLRALGEQNLSFYRSGAAGVEGTLRGEFDLGLSAFSSMNLAKMTGAPVDWVALDPTFSFPNRVAIFKGAKHPYAGLLLIDWLLNPAEGGMAIRKAGYITPEEVKSGFIQGKKLPQLREESGADEPLLERWTEAFRKGLGIGR